MNGEQGADVLSAVLVLVLALSSLLAYRLPMAKLAKMILAWTGIFALFFLIFSFRPELKLVWNRVSGELTGAPRQEVSQGAIQLTRQDDGHFWISAAVNGTPVDFMVDSGASLTAINATTADELQLEWREVLPHVDIATANGRVKANKIELAEISAGSFSLNGHDVVIAEEFGDTNVVGMNFLDAFASVRVEGDYMTLEP
jgi:aspartyl protease family protein